jgi:hypothetical protein
MNPTDAPRWPCAADDNRSHAVLHAEKGATAWQAAADYQAGAAPDHAAFYALAGDLVDTLRALSAITWTLAIHTGRYDQGREVYDDENANPAHRLRAAVIALEEARRRIAQAERAANHYWSAIGHIGVRHHDDEGERS